MIILSKATHTMKLIELLSCRFPFYSGGVLIGFHHWNLRVLVALSFFLIFFCTRETKRTLQLSWGARQTQHASYKEIIHYTDTEVFIIKILFSHIVLILSSHRMIDYTHCFVMCQVVIMVNLRKIFSLIGPLKISQEGICLHVFGFCQKTKHVLFLIIKGKLE